MKSIKKFEKKIVFFLLQFGSFCLHFDFVHAMQSRGIMSLKGMGKMSRKGTPKKFVKKSSRSPRGFLFQNKSFYSGISSPKQQMKISQKSEGWMSWLLQKLGFRKPRKVDIEKETVLLTDITGPAKGTVLRGDLWADVPMDRERAMNIISFWNPIDHKKDTFAEIASKFHSIDQQGWASYVKARLKNTELMLNKLNQAYEFLKQEEEQKREREMRR